MDGFSTSFQRNYPKEKVAQLLPKLDSLAPAIPDVKVGQTLVLAYRPGTGTTVGMEGGAQITVEGKDFAEAMLGTWIGRKPIQDALKKNLLGLWARDQSATCPSRECHQRFGKGTGVKLGYEDRASWTRCASRGRTSPTKSSSGAGGELRAGVTQAARRS